MMNADFIIFTPVENFQKGFPALHQSYWPTFLQHFEQKLVEGLKIKRRARHEKSEFLSKEPLSTCMSVLYEGGSVAKSLVQLQALHSVT